MTDNLHDRIAAVLFDELNSDRQDWKGHLDIDALADAVIRELGLTIQVAGPDGIAYGKHRYITDWITDD